MCSPGYPRLASMRVVCTGQCLRMLTCPHPVQRPTSSMFPAERNTHCPDASRSVTASPPPSLLLPPAAPDEPPAAALESPPSDPFVSPGFPLQLSPSQSHISHVTNSAIFPSRRRCPSTNTAIIDFLLTLPYVPSDTPPWPVLSWGLSWSVLSPALRTPQRYKSRQDSARCCCRRPNPPTRAQPAVVTCHIHRAPTHIQIQPLPPSSLLVPPAFGPSPSHSPPPSISP
ncbi:hypothetical protein L227DRAFT_323642 [Lentinus tigrinus ALCF2SS1-6]|uniref:Uncharacterized protein n=1 Tax=Lentinus tigrinus ALCF2SS1-6 TaxID=1328759 RepID=A0A5C2SMB8_9APHY|nr:hypothetical protein L227DRAFT_323642 [Lentinus tigrinus ALCF2SS1-6]